LECERHRRLKLWIYDLHTNEHFTIKENPLKRSDLDDFVNCYFGGESGVNAPGYSGNQHERKQSERFERFTHEELTKRDP